MKLENVDEAQRLNRAIRRCKMCLDMLNDPKDNTLDLVWVFETMQEDLPLENNPDCQRILLIMKKYISGMKARLEDKILELE